MFRLPPLLLCAALAAATPVTAETEDGLYGAAVPHDAVFVRRIGADDAPLSLFGRDFAPSELPEATYVAIPARGLDGVMPGAHYTVVGAPGSEVVVAEPRRDDPTKVYLFLLNLAAAEARLVVADEGPTVIEPTAPGEMAARGVNPLAVNLVVEAGDRAQAFDVVLRRGVNLTFLVTDDDIALLENRFGPVLEAR